MHNRNFISIYYLGKTRYPIPDVHHPDELDKYFPEALEMLKDIGFKELVYFEGKKENFKQYYS